MLLLATLLAIGMAGGVSADTPNESEQDIPRGAIVDIETPTYPHSTYDYHLTISGEQYSLSADIRDIQDPDYDLSFNTYLAGSANSDVVTGSGIGEININTETRLDGQLPQGNYTVSLRAGDKNLSQTQFSLGPQAHVPDIALYRASEMPESITEEIVTAKIADNSLVQTDQVVDPAHGNELVVLEADAPGLSGILAGTNRATLSGQFAALASTEAIDGRITVSEGHAPLPFEESTVVRDSETFYFVWNSSTLVDATDTLKNTRSVSGSLQLTITDARYHGLGSGVPPYERGFSHRLIRSGTTDIAIKPEHSELNIPGDDGSIPTSEDVTIGIETNLAPGTSGQITIHSKDAKRSYLFRDRVTISERQAVVGNFNLTRAATEGDTVIVRTEPFDTAVAELRVVDSEAA